VLLIGKCTARSTTLPEIAASFADAGITLLTEAEL
jgi:hypothetical protein